MREAEDSALDGVTSVGVGNEEELSEADLDEIARDATGSHGGNCCDAGSDE